MEKEVEALTRKEVTLKDQHDALGPAKTRADRDFRKQRIMTFRTLLLENVLMAFFQTLNGIVPLNIGIETLIELFFKRSGTYRDTGSEMVYRIHTGGSRCRRAFCAFSSYNGVFGRFSVNRVAKIPPPL